MDLKPEMPIAASVFIGPGRDRVYPDAAFAEVFGEIEDARLKRRLGYTHYVIVLYDLFAAVVCKGYDRAAAGLLHKRGGLSGEVYKGVGAYVHRHLKALSRGIEELALKLVLVGEGERVNEYIEFLPHSFSRWSKTESISASFVTSQGSIIFEPRLSARGVTRPFSTSPAYVKASSAPSSCSFCEMAHAMLRSFATPKMTAFLPC